MTLPKLGPTRTMYTGKIFSIKERDVELLDGTNTIYEYCERPSSVSVLAFNEHDELLMFKEHRPGYDETTWFLPSGRMDVAGEDPAGAALRELREETGYTARSMQLIHKKSPSSTLIWDIYIFAARDLSIDPLPKDKTEHIEPPVFIPFKDAVQMALDGTIENEFIAYHIIRFDYMRNNGQFTWE